MTQSLNDKLWSNTSKVNLANKLLLLSANGHGPFIQTKESTFFYDLRLNSERPFIGHNHPVSIQYQNKSYDLSLPNAYLLNEEEYILLRQSHEFISFSETDFMNSASIDIQLNDHMSYLIEENHLIGLDGKNLYYFQYLQSQHKNIILASRNIFSDLILVKEIAPQSINNLETTFYAALADYLKYVVDGEQNEGKNSIDFKIIDKFLEDKQHITRIYRYLVFKETLSQADLAKNGILSSKETNALSIPVACTNDELLDILERIKLSL